MVTESRVVSTQVEVIREVWSGGELAFLTQKKFTRIARRCENRNGTDFRTYIMQRGAWRALLLAASGAALYMGPDSCPCLTTHASERLRSLLSSSTYGLGCAPHDVDLSKCANQRALCDTVAPRPSYCSDYKHCSRSWCYVKRDECSVLHMTGEHGIAYSYAACGEIDYYTQSLQHLEVALQDAVLRVMYRHNSGGWIGAFHPLGGSDHRDEQWHGPFPRLLDQISTSSGAVINITAEADIPEPVRRNAAAFATSKSNYSKVRSAFTECVFYAGLGYVDLCLGEFIMSLERSALASFHAVRPTNYYLIVQTAHARNDKSISSHVSAVLAPFTLRLWVLIFVAAIGASFLLAAQDRSAAGGDFETGSLPVLSGRAAWLGAMGVLGGDLSHQGGMRLSSRLTGLGLTFFLFVVGTGYTASVAAFLIIDAQSTPVSDIEEAISRHHVFCAPDYIHAFLVDAYPSMEILPGFHQRNSAFDALLSGDCNAIVTDIEDLHVLHAASTRYCSLAAVGRPVHTVQTGFPIAESVKQPVVYHAQKVMRSWEASLRPPISVCRDYADAGDAATFTVSDFSGAFLLLACFALASTSVSAIEHLQRAHARRSEADTADLVVCSTASATSSSATGAIGGDLKTVVMENGG